MMGCCIESWRCAIGVFYGKSAVYFIHRKVIYKNAKSSILDLISLIVRAFVSYQYLILIQSLNPQLNILCFLFLFLFICGDVHPNPGPSSEILSISSHTSDLIHNCLTVMHLNIRRHKIRLSRVFLR